MGLHDITAADAITRLDQFSAIIDARSESEFALDHLPGAINWPSLRDEERARVGTLYKQVSPFDARKLGATLVARNIADHLERHGQLLTRDWKPLVYCWRGGQRSGSLSLVLSQVGFRVTRLDGGYRAFRAALVEDTARIAPAMQWRVLCGPTGVGKTRLLANLQASGAQVLDLEGLACHRSSVLGQTPGQEQPSQKRLDTLIWDALRQFDPKRPVFVESESRKIGRLALPTALVAAMHASPCLLIELPLAERVRLLMRDYEHFVHDSALFGERLDLLRQLRGRAVIDAWKARAAAGDVAGVVHDLLATHYDPLYAASTRRNYQRYEHARTWHAQRAEDLDDGQFARDIIAQTP